MNTEHPNVIDFFSQRPYTQITTQDTNTNDAVTNEFGVYLGILKKWDSDNLRRLIREIDFKQSQIDELTEQVDQFQYEYDVLFQHCLNYMNLPKSMVIDDEKDTFSIDIKGHMWITRDFEKLKNEHLSRRHDE